VQFPVFADICRVHAQATLATMHHNRFFEIRMEMYNPFNRIVFPNIGVGNPITSPTRNSNLLLTGGIGFTARCVRLGMVGAAPPRSVGSLPR
jgi:hypothetical protein